MFEKRDGRSGGRGGHPIFYYLPVLFLLHAFKDLSWPEAVTRILLSRGLIRFFGGVWGRSVSSLITLVLTFLLHFGLLSSQHLAFGHFFFREKLPLLASLSSCLVKFIFHFFPIGWGNIPYVWARATFSIPRSSISLHYSNTVVVPGNDGSSLDELQ